MPSCGIVNVVDVFAQVFAVPEVYVESIICFVVILSNIFVNSFFVFNIFPPPFCKA